MGMYDAKLHPSAPCLRADVAVKAALPGQSLTTSARELTAIANSPATPIEYVETVGKTLASILRSNHSKEFEAKSIKVHIVTYMPKGSNNAQYWLLKPVEP
jgi:hypothetical protein